MMGSHKGVSPLIAAVLLIAFTMAVAAILTAWITSFTSEKTTYVGNESSKIIKCSYAGLSIYDAVWDSSNNKVLVSIANTGTVDLSSVNVYAFKGGAQQGTNKSENLGSAEIRTISIGAITSKPDKVTVTTPDCPSRMIKDEETSISIK